MAVGRLKSSQLEKFSGLVAAAEAAPKLQEHKPKESPPAPKPPTRTPAPPEAKPKESPPAPKPRASSPKLPALASVAPKPAQRPDPSPKEPVKADKSLCELVKIDKRWQWWEEEKDEHCQPTEANRQFLRHRSAVRTLRKEL